VELIEDHQRRGAPDRDGPDAVDERTERPCPFAPLERIEARALADLVLESPYQQGHDPRERPGQQDDHQDLHPFVVGPGSGLAERHTGTRPRADQLEGGEKHQRRDDHEDQQADETERSADERTGRRQLVPHARFQQPPNDARGDDGRK
jgi:hypothetical protein